jgi:pimeloyl-ACP methyl ester carboxylesterase
MGKLCESSEGTRRTLQGISTTMRTVHGEAMAEATVNGVRLAYELQGHGTPILFLPGTGMVKEAWLGGPAPALADAGYQVVLVDNRGVGGSDAPPAPYAVADLAADTAGLIEQLGIGRCRLAGYSFGGFVAEHLAAERPDLVRAVALLGSAGPPTAYLQFSCEAELEMVRQGIDLPQRKQVADALAGVLTPSQLQDEALVQRIAERMLALPPWGNPGRHGQFAARHAWGTGYRATHAARWAKISVPVLAVAFEQDVAFPPGSARLLTQAIPGAQLTVILDAGHGGVFTHAAEVGEALLKFFAAT